MEDTARIQKAQRSTGEIRQYRVVGHRKSHAIRGCQKKKLIFAPVAELADAYGSGPYFRKEVQVRFLSGAPKTKPESFTLCKRFGLFVFYENCEL